MEEILPATNPTNATTVTMKYLLFLPIIIPKLTYITIVTSKINPTINTSLRARLYSQTLIAPNLFSCMPFKLMVLFGVHFFLKLDFVMTNPAREEFFAYFTFFVTPSIVVLTASFIVMA